MNLHKTLQQCPVNGAQSLDGAARTWLKTYITQPPGQVINTFQAGCLLTGCTAVRTAFINKYGQQRLAQWDLMANDTKDLLDTTSGSDLAAVIRGSCEGL